jgi:hypothetical protein
LPGAAFFGRVKVERVTDTVSVTWREKEEKREED